MEKLEARPLIFDATEIGRAGAFVTLDRDGELVVYRGFVRPEQTMASTAEKRRQTGREASHPLRVTAVAWA